MVGYEVKEYRKQFAENICGTCVGVELASSSLPLSLPSVEVAPLMGDLEAFSGPTAVTFACFVMSHCTDLQVKALLTVPG